MEIRISPGARKFLESIRAETVVVRFLELEAGCMVGVAKEIDISFEPPEDVDSFERARAEGFDFFIDKRLKPSGDVVIKKQGFWRFSSLYADGLRVPI